MAANVRPLYWACRPNTYSEPATMATGTDPAKRLRFDLFTEHVDNTHSEACYQMAFNTFDSYHLPPYHTYESTSAWAYGSGLCQSGHWLLSTRYGSLGRVGLRGTGSRSGRLTKRMDAMDSTTKQDGYELRQRMEWMDLMARAWETQGKSTVKLPGQAANRCWRITYACVGFSSILLEDYDEKAGLEKNSENLAGTQARYGQYL